MRHLKYSLAFLLAFSLPVWAGFDGYNGNTQLGIFNKIQCSTGTTCTRYKDSFQIVSSPSVTGGSFTLTAAASTATTFDMQANNNAVSGDDWQIKSLISEGGMAFLNNTSGSQVTKWSITTAGNVTNVGSLTVDGAIIPTGGIGTGTSTFTNFAGWVPSAITDATSTTPSATTVYLTQIHVAHNFTATGVQVLNAATCGSTKWIVALFNEAGTVLANSNTAGVTCSGASGIQQLPFTSTFAVTGPATYWLGLYANNTTDRFYAIPAAGGFLGRAGTVTGQTFGTIVNVTPPTTFTAGAGAVLSTY
jgi:hypothetical protein